MVEMSRLFVNHAITFKALIHFNLCLSSKGVNLIFSITFIPFEARLFPFFTRSVENQCKAYRIIHCQFNALKNAIYLCTEKLQII